MHSCNCHTSRLPVGVVDMNVIGSMCVVPHDCALLAGVLVGLLHRVCVPVSPVDPVLKQGNGKDMRKSTAKGPVSVLAVHICKAEGGHSEWLVHGGEIQAPEIQSYIQHGLTPGS